MSEDTETRHLTITEKTRVPLSIILAIFIPAISGTLWINNTLNEIKNQIAVLQLQVSELRNPKHVLSP